MPIPLHASKPRARLPLTLALFAVPIGGTLAQQTSTPTELDAVEVMGQMEDIDPDSHDVDTARLRRTLARDLRDTFATDPSVRVGSGARNGQKIMLRGLEDLNLNVNIDGARQGANLFHHQGRMQIDPFLLKRAEVHTGPAAADAGPGALGGSVSFETVDAQDLLEGGDAGARLIGQYADGTDTLGGSASAYTLVGERLGLLAYGRYLDDGLTRAGGGQKLRSTDGRRESYLLKGSLLQAGGHDLRLGLERNDNTGGILRANFPWQVGNAIQADDDQATRRDTLSLQHHYHRDTSQWLDLKTRLYHNDARLDLYREAGNERYRTESKGGDLRNLWRLRTGPLRHELTAGLDYYKDRGSRYGPDGHFAEHAENTGLFVQDRIALGHFRLSAGLRNDRYRARYANGYGQSGQRTSPNLSAEMHWGGEDNHVGVHAGYGESSRGAKLNQAGWLQKYTSGDAFSLGENGHLKPEVALQQQAGLRWQGRDLLQAGDHAGLELRVYRTRIRDYQVVPGEGLGGITDRIYNAAGDIVSKGWELFGHWGRDTLHASFAYSHNDIHDYDGLPLDTTGDSARIGVSTGDRFVHDLQWHGLHPSLTLGYTLTAVRWLDETRPGRPEKPGYAVHDLQLVWQPPARPWTLTFGIDNLFDKRYADHTSVRVLQATNSANATAGVEYANWEVGRNLKLAAEWRF